VLGDGTPDGQVLAIPALKLNGKAVTGKAKPKYTGLCTIQAHSYYTGFRKIAFIMDEEDNNHLPHLPSNTQHMRGAT